MNLTITANNAPELKNKLQELIKTFDLHSNDHQMDLPLPKLTEVKQPEVLANGGTAPKGKRGRKPLTPTTPTPTTPIQQAATVIPADKNPFETDVINVGQMKAQMDAPTADLTLEAIRKYLEQVSETHGMLLAKDVVSRFGVAKISALDKAQYGNFVAACQKAVATGVA